ncbi:MAG: tonB-system energizer ExbB [Hyphomicrobiaceae bacterium]
MGADTIGAARRIGRSLSISLVLVLALTPGAGLAQGPQERVAPPMRAEMPSSPSTPSAPAGEEREAPPPAAGVQLRTLEPAAPPSGGPTEAAPAAVPGTDARPAAPLQGGIERSHLPHDLSPWGMFMAADVVVQAVMIGLALASLAVWTVWLAKLMELMMARIGLRRGLRALAAESSLDTAATHLTHRTPVARGMVALARREIALSEDVLNGAGLRERVASRLAGLDAALSRRMRRGLSLLATVGATAPFIGLFGTVWGIMNSFIGISKSQTTSLAVVAPGIAEALLATGIGLVAAIPAVILYNHLGRSIATYRALVRETRDEVERLASRDIDRQMAHRPPAALARRG